MDAKWGVVVQREPEVGLARPWKKNQRGLEVQIKQRSDLLFIHSLHRVLHPHGLLKKGFINYWLSAK